MTAATKKLLVCGAVAGPLFVVTFLVSGYPPGTPDAILRHSTHGTLHDLFSMPTFLAWPIACIVSAIHSLRGQLGRRIGLGHLLCTSAGAFQQGPRFCRCRVT